jgi:hypothetical protein
MANLVTDMLVGLVRGIVNLIPEPVTDGFNSVVDFAYVNFLGLPFIVLGYRQTGKTTLLQWLRTNYKPRNNFEPEPTAAGGEAVRTFTTRAGDERMRVRARRDVGGEYSMWETDWVDLLRDAKPRGIIFMIDGDNPIAHKDALNFTLQMLDEEVVSIKNLKAFMLLVNKADLWSEDRTMEEVLEDFRTETRRMHHQAQKLGYEVIIQSTSLKDGAGIREAVEQFFKRIRPHRKRSRAAAR